MKSSDIAISVEDVSKCYRIGLKEKMHDSFAGAIDNLRETASELAVVVDTGKTEVLERQMAEFFNSFVDVYITGFDLGQ